MIDKYIHSLFLMITQNARILRRHKGIDTPKLIAIVVTSVEGSLRKGCLQFRIKETSINLLK